MLWLSRIGPAGNIRKGHQRQQCSPVLHGALAAYVLDLFARRTLPTSTTSSSVCAQLLRVRCKITAASGSRWLAEADPRSAARAPPAEFKSCAFAAQAGDVDNQRHGAITHDGGARIFGQALQLAANGFKSIPSPVWKWSTTRPYFIAPIVRYGNLDVAACVLPPVSNLAPPGEVAWRGASLRVREPLCTGQRLSASRISRSSSVSPSIWIAALSPDSEDVGKTHDGNQFVSNTNTSGITDDLDPFFDLVRADAQQLDHTDSGIAKRSWPTLTTGKA